MKLQLIQAPNMKIAMMRIQDEMGANAMIYRTRNNQGGIEVLAGVPSEMGEDEKEDYSFDDVKKSSSDMTLSNTLETRLDSIDKTMRALTDKIQVFEIANGLIDSRSSVAIKYQNYFKELGFGENVVASMFQSFIDKQTSVEHLSMNVHQEILRNIRKYDDEIINKKTIAAMVGPTGAGKTTTIVKLATRFLENNKSEKLGIISTDIEDLSIKNKLSHYCNLFDIDFEFVNTPDEMNHVIKKMADKDLVLIDTHGVSQRDGVAVKSLISLFDKSYKKIAVYLTLPCNQQEVILNDIIKTFTFKRIAGCILTKVDESIKITPALGVVMMHKVAIAYLCNGQDIDRDIVLPTLKVLANSLPIVFHNEHVEPEIKRKSFKWMRPFKSLGFRYFK